MRQGIGLGVGINRSNYAQGIFGAYATRVVADGGVVEGGSCVDAVSGLLLNASLLLIPSGYKANKLYSEIPTNGNGDLTWTRTSTANRTNSSGNIELMATGVPRLDYTYGSCPSALLEPQRTNLVVNSTMVGAVAGSPGTAPTTWTFNGGIGLTRTISLGTENGLEYIDFRFQGTATQTFITILPNSTSYSSSAGQVYTFSAYIKLVSGSIPNFRLVQLDNASNAYTTTFNPTSTLTRYTQTTSALPVGNTSIRPYFDTNSLSIGQAYDFTIRIAQPQMELGAYATTPIFTSGATATRVADSFSRNNIYTNGLISASGGTWFVELRGNVALTPDTTGQGISLGDNITPTSGNQLQIRSLNSSSRIILSKRVAGTFTSLYTTTTNTCKIIFKWNGSTLDIFENGVKVITATSFTATALEYISTNILDAPKFIQQMALFPTPLSDTDCATITTI